MTDTARKPPLTAETALSARTLGRLGGLRRTDAQQQARAANARKGGRPRSTLWWAVARHDGYDAGIVCCDLTKDGCREKARTRTSVSFVVRRDRATPEQIAALRAVGKV